MARHLNNDESGLIYMGARYYNPTIAQFLTPDSILPSPTDSLSYNKYSYTRNNPINLVDPSGNFFWAPIIGAIIGGLMAAVSGQNILMGMWIGAASGAFFGAAGGSFWGSVAAGFASGAMNSALYGGNILRGAIVGAISAGIGYGIGSLGRKLFPSLKGYGMGAVSAISGGVVGGLSSVMMGGSFSEGFKMGFISAGLSYAANEVSREINTSEKGISSEGNELYSPLSEDQVKNIVARDLSKEGPIGKFVKNAGINLDLSKLEVIVINDRNAQSGQIQGEKMLLNLYAINNPDSATPNVSTPIERLHVLLVHEVLIHYVPNNRSLWAKVRSAVFGERFGDTWLLPRSSLVNNLAAEKLSGLVYGDSIYQTKNAIANGVWVTVSEGEARYNEVIAFYGVKP